MIFNRPKKAKKKQLKWYLNQTIQSMFPNAGIGSTNYTYVNFKAYSPSMSLGNYTRIGFTMYYFGLTMQYVDANGLGVTAYDGMSGGWGNSVYRTIIFDEEPTGDLLTWLQANATPQ